MSERANTAAAARPSTRSASMPVLQRACACGQHTAGGGECAECRQKHAVSLQRAATAGGPHMAPPIVHQVLGAPGQPLDSTTRALMEPRFGHDFSSVRIHTDTQAAESARAVGALAYAVGSHIAFESGQYAPGSGAGRRLLAHELTHVVQQPALPSGVPIFIGAAETPHEREAERSSQRANMSGGRDPIRVVGRQGMLHRASAGVGAGIGALGGAAVGALIGGIVGGPLGALAGGLIGGVVGLIAGAIIGEAIGSDAGARMHFETRDADVPLVSDPLQPAETVVQTLPAGTRVAIVDEGANQPFNRGSGDWVLVRVTTGPHINERGWLRRGQLISRPETTEVTPEDAARLFVELGHASFLTTQNSNAPVPFHYPPDGCYARAYRMSQLLTEMGYATERVFAVSRVSGRGAPRAGLRVPTNFAQNVPPRAEPAVEWWYHVAPIIKVRDPQGRLVDTVIDPSMMNGPATIEQWTGRMSRQTFTRLTLDQVHDLLRANRDNYPVDQPITFTAPRDTYYPPQLGRPDPGPEEEQSSSRAVMTNYAARAQVHELAASIRQSLLAQPIDVGAIVAAIGSAPAAVRQALPKMFGGLVIELHERLTPADQQRVDTALGQP